jgi:hypothetical protein
MKKSGNHPDRAGPDRGPAGCGGAKKAGEGDAGRSADRGLALRACENGSPPSQRGRGL